MADDLLLQMAGEVARIGAVVDDLAKLLKDNGQPGIISRFQTVENIQRECQRRHEEERNLAKEAALKIARDAERRETRIVTICISGSSIASGVIVWLLNTFIGG